MAYYSSVLDKTVPSRWVSAQIQADYESGTPLEKITERLETNGYKFNHPSFSELRKRTREQDDYISNPPDVVEGVVECGKCGSKKVFSVSIQTRAADEPMSTRAYCTVCKYRWTQNC